MTISELTNLLSTYPPNARVVLLYTQAKNRVYQYQIVNAEEDLVGVSLIIESSRKLTEGGNA